MPTELFRHRLLAVLTVVCLGSLLLLAGCNDAKNSAPSKSVADSGVPAGKPPASTTSGAGSAQNQENVVKSIADELSKNELVRKRNNEFASKEADKAMVAELTKINGKEQTWRFEVTGVSEDKVHFYNEYIFLDDGTYRSGDDAYLAEQFPNSKGPSKVGKLTCYVWPAQRGTPERDRSMKLFSPGQNFEIGDGKLIPAATAKRLVKGDLVTIRGKVQLELSPSLNEASAVSIRHFDLHFVDTRLVAAGK